MDYNNIFFITIVILIILSSYKYLETHTYDVVYVASALNNKSYLVRNVENKQDAADMIARISMKLEKLVSIIKMSSFEDIYTKYLLPDLGALFDNEETEDGEYNNVRHINERKKKLKDDIERLVDNFNPDNFSETTPDAKYTSYSVNKGEKIVFCLRDKKDGLKLVDDNTMLFVSIHEIAHLMTKSVGHEPEFWENFKFLLRVAVDNNIYYNVNFNNEPKNYCGIKITDTPLKEFND